VCYARVEITGSGNYTIMIQVSFIIVVQINSITSYSFVLQDTKNFIG